MTDKGMKKALRIVLQLLINIILILIIMQVFMFAYNFFYKVFTDTCVDSSDTREIQFVIVPDSSTTEIVDALADDGLITDPYVMLAKIYLSSYHGKIKPGTYILQPSMTQEEIMKIITATQEKQEDEDR